MEKILANLKKGIIAPCYLLYGEEEYLINEALNKILDFIVPESDRDFSLFYLDGENTDMDSLIGTSFNTFPFRQQESNCGEKHHYLSFPRKSGQTDSKDT